MAIIPYVQYLPVPPLLFAERGAGGEVLIFPPSLSLPLPSATRGPAVRSSQHDIRQLPDICWSGDAASRGRPAQRVQSSHHWQSARSRLTPPQQRESASD